MKLILTHEQADLDALGSLLGAHLLEAGSFALLPRTINRNGLAFIQRFGDRLDFSTLQDLPSEIIEQITLVDTQSLVTLRGYSPRTEVNVIDHHPRKATLDPAWKLEIQFTGACTTLIVEKIRQAQISLNPSQATLMLMGIYEDTGSMGYTSTTSRDVYAAAWLLENGADLNVAAQYLNAPLSGSQQLLYDRLLKDINTFNVEDHHIVIAKASALDLHDEISTVAHKMREFLNPDGLILLVSTRQGIRLIGRSTTDDVDMGKLARYFGGGGHNRAASALIRSEAKPSSDEIPALWRKVYQQIISLLPNIVRPATRVRQIMSNRPLLLSPDLPVEEVAELMQRYGFEGFPVVEEGKVIGLITRRNVDRALGHKMHAVAASLMDAGNVSVLPSDTIQHLREVMTSTGWGQVPVIDPQTDEVIGIVTRTDLINTLTQNNSVPGQEEMTALLNKAIPYERQVLLQALAAEADRFGVQAYIVGGFVRDLLLQRPSQDFDVVIEGNAIDFVDHLVSRFGGRSVSHRRFHTAKWVLAGQKAEVCERIHPEKPLQAELLPDHLDLITARTEFYEKPAALPVVESSSIKMDLHRRDFTINTLALRLDGPYFGKLFDFWGGYSDLRNRNIRVLHALSFVDDATRILRAVRFATRFDFKIEPRTLSLLKENLPLLEQISGARIKHEFDLILLEPKAIQMFEALDDLGILKAIHPLLPWDQTAASRLRLAASAQVLPNQGDENSQKEQRERKLEGLYSLWLADLVNGQLAPVARRLRLSTNQVRKVIQTGKLLRLLPSLAGAKPSQVVNALDDFQLEVIQNVLGITSSPTEHAVLENYLTIYRHIKPGVDGNELRRLGLPPSPRYQTLLDALRAAWLDGEVSSSEGERTLLEKLISQK